MNPSPVAKGLNANLENFELTDIMQLITQQVKCGILSVESSDGSCSWSFNKGDLVDFNCHFPGHSLDLKTILIKDGRLNESGLISLQKEYSLSSAHGLEKTLVENGIINREELERINLRRLIESFIITIQWTKGQYKFIPAGEVKSTAFFPPQDTNFLILEAMRQIDEIALMKKRLLPLEKVYETTLSLDSNESSAENVSLFQEGLEKQFDQDEYRIYKLFDGKRCLAEVINISIIGQFNACRIALNFLDRGIITPRTSESADDHSNNSNKRNHNLTGIALLLLSWALIISVSTSIWHFEPLGKKKSPTFFTAIIDNLRADQEMIRKQARELLR